LIFIAALLPVLSLIEILGTLLVFRPSLKVTINTHLKKCVTTPDDRLPITNDVNFAPLQLSRPPTSTKNCLQSSISFGIESMNGLEEIFIHHYGCNAFTRQKQLRKNCFEKIRKGIWKLGIMEKCVSSWWSESGVGPASESRKRFKFAVGLVKIANLHQK
jgi:hypothetical protein